MESSSATMASLTTRRVARGDFGHYSEHDYERTISYRLSEDSTTVDGKSYFHDLEFLLSRRVDLLPISADRYYFPDTLELHGWNPTLKTILLGTRQQQAGLQNANPPSSSNSSATASKSSCPWTILRDHETTIVRYIYSFLIHPWAHHVRLTIPAPLVGMLGRDHYYPGELVRFSRGRADDLEWWRSRDDLNDDESFVAFSKCGKVTFPELNDEGEERNINMMPFIFGDIQSLPENLQCYYPLIEQCPYMRDEMTGKVGYLTVHESNVDVGKAQRREGLHIESPGLALASSSEPTTAGTTTMNAAFCPAMENSWGKGEFFGPDRYEGGIYMASSVSNTSIVYDALINNKIPGIVDQHGGCEHLRTIIGPGTSLHAGDLIWMTDCTPHEAIPQEESGYRRFFRVVTPQISHWFADHSTPNPHVPLPSYVRIVRGNKFI